MKKLFITFAMLILLTGCANNNKNLTPMQEAPSQSQPPITAPITYSPPTAENIVFSSYSTKILDKKKSRIRNIELSIEAINKVTLQPGETFSFNKTVGPRTEARGYEKALMIIKKEKTLGYGGGVCQVSTTIYNAARGANLEIVERHQHEAEVGYVKLGDDATVNYGTLDLKIKNNMDMPIKFRVSLGKNTIEASVVTAN